LPHEAHSDTDHRRVINKTVQRLEMKDSDNEEEYQGMDDCMTHSLYVSLKSPIQRRRCLGFALFENPLIVNEKSKRVIIQTSV
jgi:hypothetical protein